MRWFRTFLFERAYSVLVRIEHLLLFSERGHVFIDEFLEQTQDGKHCFKSKSDTSLCGR